MPAISDVLVTWRGLTLGSAPFDINGFSGWLDRPDGRFESESAWGHGASRSPVVVDQRTVNVTGFLRSTLATRDALVAQLRAVMIPARSDNSDTEPLSVFVAGETNVAEAQLVSFGILTDERWARGQLIQWRAQWRCPDPRIYGAELTASAVLITGTPGITLPRTMPFTMPAKPIGGALTVTNPGNDPEGSPATYLLSGEQLVNVGLRVNDRVLRYGFPIALTDQLLIDTERGAFLNGEYRPAVGFSDIPSSLRLLPGVNQIRALGVAGSGTPTVTVIYRPAKW